MGLVLLVGTSLAVALTAGELARRAVLGNRMDRSLAALKATTRQSKSRDDVLVGAPVRGTVSIRDVRPDHGPIASNEESLAKLMATRVRQIHHHARRAS
jgi:hypothetical protein